MDTIKVPRFAEHRTKISVAMLDKAIQSEPSAFFDFDRTKNVQDQLQEMIKDKRNYGIDLAFDLWSFIEVENKRRFNSLIEYSMEQLWLAFVMKDKGKIWDGSEWIKQEILVADRT